MKITNKIQETLQSIKRIFLFRKYKTIESSSKQNQNRVTLSSSKGTTWKDDFRKGLMMGFGIMLGMFGTGVMAVAVTGTIKTWTANEKLTAGDLNTAFSSLKTAVEGIPNWTRYGTSAYYTTGNVGIGMQRV